MKEIDSITALSQEIDTQSDAVMALAKGAMMVIGTVVSIYYVTGKVMEFKLNRKMRQIQKENQKQEA